MREELLSCQKRVSWSLVLQQAGDSRRAATRTFLS